MFLVNPRVTRRCPRGFLRPDYVSRNSHRLCRRLRGFPRPDHVSLVIHVCYVNVPTSEPRFLHIYVYHSDVTEVSHDRTMFLVIHVYDRDACNSRPFTKKL